MKNSVRFAAMLLAFAALGLFQNVHGQQSGARNTALGNAETSLQDLWSVASNPAGAATITRAAGGISYESSFLSDEISLQQIAFAVPLGGRVAGAEIYNYGFSAYSEQRAGLSCAQKFGKELFIGIKLNYHRLQIPGYGSSSTWSAEAGMQYYLSPALLMGVHIANPAHNTFNGNFSTTLPVKLAVGCTAFVSPAVLLVTEFRTVTGGPGDFSAGLEYVPAGRLLLRGGLSFSPFTQYGGFGYRYDRVTIDGAVSVHPGLGYSPQLSVNYAF